ncbi:MAG TPA: hypothetical protein PK691_10140 [Thermomicrobiales bacterium]|nr:hypothetical protein [Thermomicrobiales bacterium]HRA48408.1 hypothetical protein [Thermomicrobiales bacterium]
MVPHNLGNTLATHHDAMTSARLAALLEEDSPRILINWSMHIATLPILRALPDLSLDDLQRDMPRLLSEILHSAGRSPYERNEEPMNVATDLALEHGRERAAIFPIEAVLSEIQILVREVRSALWRLGAGFATEMILELEDRLREVFDEVECAVAVGWVKQTLEMAAIEWKEATA